MGNFKTEIFVDLCEYVEEKFVNGEMDAGKRDELMTKHIELFTKVIKPDEKSEARETVADLFRRNLLTPTELLELESRLE